MKRGDLKVGMLVRLNSSGSTSARRDGSILRQKAGRHFYGVVTELRSPRRAGISFDVVVDVFGAAGGYKDGKGWLFDAYELSRVKRYG